MNDEIKIPIKLVKRDKNWQFKDSRVVNVDKRWLDREAQIQGFVEELKDIQDLSKCGLDLSPTEESHEDIQDQEESLDNTEQTNSFFDTHKKRLEIISWIGVFAVLLLLLIIQKPSESSKSSAMDLEEWSWAGIKFDILKQELNTLDDEIIKEIELQKKIREKKKELNLIIDDSKRRVNDIQTKKRGVESKIILLWN